MRQNLSTAKATIQTLRAEVARLEEQKARMAFDIESARNTARFFKRKLDSQQPRVTLASRNRPKEPGLQEKKLAASSSSAKLSGDEDDSTTYVEEGAWQEEEEEEAAEAGGEEEAAKPRPSSCFDRVTSASRV